MQVDIIRKIKELGFEARSFALTRIEFVIGFMANRLKDTTKPMNSTDSNSGEILEFLHEFSKKTNMN